MLCQEKLGDAYLTLAYPLPHQLDCSFTWQGVRVEVEVGGLQSWMDSSELEAVLAPLTLAASRKIATEELVREDILADERCKVAFTAVQVRSQACCPSYGLLSFPTVIALHQQRAKFCGFFLTLIGPSLQNFPTSALTIFALAYKKQKESQKNSRI